MNVKPRQWHDLMIPLHDLVGTMPGLEVEAAGMFNLPHVCVLLVGFPPLVGVLPLDLVDVVVNISMQARV